uniref:Uncharacterized protein n=1 Tax=Rhizophora mucronata TaxID=61149 RepID=A0A2P2QWC5_RHIMU
MEKGQLGHSATDRSGIQSEFEEQRLLSL